MQISVKLYCEAQFLTQVAPRSPPNLTPPPTTTYPLPTSPFLSRILNTLNHFLPVV